MHLQSNIVNYKKVARRITLRIYTNRERLRLHYDVSRDDFASTFHWRPDLCACVCALFGSVHAGIRSCVWAIQAGWINF